MTRRTAAGLAVLGLLVAGGVFGSRWRVPWIINSLLRDWAAGTIARESGEVYQLEFGRARFSWTQRRVTVDSISLTTRRAANERRPQPLPGLRVTLKDCTISGVHALTLIRRAGLIASSFGCRSGALAVEVPRGVPGDPVASTPVPAAAGTEARQAFLVFQQGLQLPPYAPRIRIAQVLFPRLAFDVRLKRTAAGAARLQLERLQWSMTDVVIDPDDKAAASRPLFSRSVELMATNFVAHPDSATAVRVGLLRTILTDSTLEIRNVALEPGADGNRRYRHDRIDFAVGRITVAGIDFGAFVRGHGVWARLVEVDSFRMDVASDKRLARRPGNVARRTPQQWVSSFDETLILDSLRVRRGEVTYREHAAGRRRAGVFTFARIEADAANVHHIAGRKTGGDPMTLTMRAFLQGAGRLDVRFVVPLDAPRFDMAYSGTLGPMAVQAFNPFVSEIEAVRIDDGRVAGVRFSVEVRGGVATGIITPRFNDLSVSVTRDGSSGILGSSGVAGGAARFVAGLAADVMVRSDNPGDPGSAPRSGAISRTFRGEGIISFLWVGTRDGLLRVIRK